ncbi:FAD-dependent oxidoreductase [Sneathiella sp.]|uniref:FAD-dependent oxidoreductase n=1 Tax=Sneathiella sp. TaxID=1964365 RepID=UPI002FE38532
MARIWPFAYLVRNSKARGPRRGAAPGETPIRFRFNGRRYRGVAGDTLASALLANGCARIGWSVRYHRPRGSEALVRLAHQDAAAAPVPAREVELCEGLNAISATSLLPDIKTLGRRAASLLAKRRRPAGAEARAEEATFALEHLYLHTDLAIVGSGPAGLARALDAARNGREVIVIEQDFEIGGSLLYDATPVDGIAAADWRSNALAELAANPHVTILTRVAALSRDGAHRLLCRETIPPPARRANPFLPACRDIEITAMEIAIEAGREDISFIFKNNDLPGIFQLSDALSLMVRHGVLPGHKAVLYCDNDAAYQFAADARDHGLLLAAIIDTRADVPAPCHQFARAAGIPLYPHHEIIAARGPLTLRQVILGKRAEGAREIYFDCDALIQSAAGGDAGSMPTPELRGLGKAFIDPAREQLYTRGAAVPTIGAARAIATRATGTGPREVLPGYRITPFSSAFEKAGGRMSLHAGWRMAECFPRDDMSAAGRREALAAREKVGLLDLSDFGRIDLQGPDVCRFLETIAPSTDWETQPVGSIRHVPLSAPDGRPSAEFFAWRIAATRYLLTTHSSFAEAILNIVRTQLGSAGYHRIFVRDVSDDQAALLLTGPRAEAVLARALPLGVMETALAPMRFRHLNQDGMALTLARLDLTGAVGFVIFTGAGHADLLLNLLREKGRDQGLKLIGTTAGDILRIEAGGLSAAEMAIETGPAGQPPRQLVGLRVVSPPTEAAEDTRLAPGMTLHEGDGKDPFGRGIGTITSACRSALFAGDIALAQVEDGEARHGSLIRAVEAGSGRIVDVKVGPPHFYAPGKENRHA